LSTPSKISSLLSEVESPRPLRASAGRITISGWCLFDRQTEPPAVRLRAGDTILPATARIARPDLAKKMSEQPAAAHCGFEISGPLPAGVHVGQFEAQSPEGSWQVFKKLTLVVTPPPFLAVIDTPVAHGVLADRVKVGGWALHPSEEIISIALHYGHREIYCRTGLPRTDVPRLHPENSFASRSGFETLDYLVAGYGPVRVKARLADGSTAIAGTSVSFAVETDETHSPALHLDETRVSLDRPAKRLALPAEGDRQPLNVLFILYGSFASNSALHVAALANELTATGHSCIVTVSSDPETLSHLDRPAFRGITHDEARAGVRFTNGRGPDIVHAWTIRENVRALAESIRAQCPARLVIHLEDNEQELLALSLGRRFADLGQLDDQELDRLVPADLSHPHRGKDFLSKADGVTIVLERLREFVPLGRPCLAFTPAADARFFFPAARPDAFRQILDEKPDTTVLFYPGNTHAANVAEMNELYAALTILNDSGHPVTLIRTGRNQVELTDPLAIKARPHVIELGQILHHRHIPPLMALADIFVQPGWSDPFNDYRFPSKLPEFFSIGRPVVLPRANLGVSLRHGIDAYVLDRADAAGITRAVIELRGNPELYARLARGSVEYAETHFSWRRSAEALAGFYHSLVNS
jgi:glycosyltransferase involved in cell wall biosynthesis